MLAMPGAPSKLSRDLSNVRVQLKSGTTRSSTPRALKKTEIEALRVREQTLTTEITKAMVGGRVRATASREPGVAAAEIKNDSPLAAGSEPGALAAAKARAGTKHDAGNRRGASRATAPRRPAYASRPLSIPLSWQTPALQPSDVVATDDGKAHSASYEGLKLRAADGGVMGVVRGASCATGAEIAPVGGNTRREQCEGATLSAANSRVVSAERGASCARRAPRVPRRVTGKRCVMESATADEDETSRDRRNDNHAIETCGADYVTRGGPFADGETVKFRGGGHGDDEVWWLRSPTRGASYCEETTKKKQRGADTAEATPAKEGRPGKSPSARTARALAMEKTIEYSE